MNSLIRTSLLSCLLVCGASSALAQTPHQLRFRTDFSFVAAGQTMPAGTYTIQPLGLPYYNPAVMGLYRDHGLVAIMEVDSASPATGVINPPTAQNEVTFVQLGNGTWALDQVWTEEDSAGAQLAWTALNRQREMKTTTAAGAIHVPAAER